MTPGDHVEFAESGRQRATPFTKIWYAGWLAMGLSIFIGGLNPAWEPTISLNDFPDWVSLWMGAGMTLGGVALLVGVSPGIRLDRSWAWESMGCYLAGFAWLAFALATMWERPFVVIPWLFGITSAASMTARLVTLSQRENFTRRIIREDQEARERVAGDDIFMPLDPEGGKGS